MTLWNPIGEHEQAGRKSSTRPCTSEAARGSRAFRNRTSPRERAGSSMPNPGQHVRERHRPSASTSVFNRTIGLVGANNALPAGQTRQKTAKTANNAGPSRRKRGEDPLHGDEGAAFQVARRGLWSRKLRYPLGGLQIAKQRKQQAKTAGEALRILPPKTKHERTCASTGYPRPTG